MRVEALAVVLTCTAVVAGCASTGSAGEDKTLAPATSATIATSLEPSTSSPPRCHDGRFAVKMVDGVSPMTGEHSFFVQLMLTSTGPCSLRGYPTIAFRTRDGKPVPFRVIDGNGPYVTHRKPAQINLIGAGDSFFIEVAKYRCDLPSSATATVAALRLPGVRLPVTVHFGHITRFDYCTERPSQIVYVSPVLSNERQLSTYRSVSGG